ncbi:unnamed protein product, partial [Mesorhabditis spiculigera]
TEKPRVAKKLRQIRIPLDRRPLVDTLDEWRNLPTLASSLQLVNVVAQPPRPFPMPGKATFFDLAHTHLQMPDVSSHLSDLEAGAKKPEAPQPAAAPKTQTGGWFWRK